MYAPLTIQRIPDTGLPKARHNPFIQPELEIGRPDDEYEQQADAVANRVMMQPDMEEEEPIQMQVEGEEEELQMQPLEEEEKLQMEPIGDEEEIVQMEETEEEEMLQMQVENTPSVPLNSGEFDEEILQTKPVVQAKDGGGMQASPELASKISATKGTGSPLEPAIQREMGGKMGADFSGVNIHTGSDAQKMSSELGAKAFTVGSDIYFNRGQYATKSSEGKRLLAHELTHTVQQGAVRRKVIQREDETLPQPPSGVTPVETNDERVYGYRKDGDMVKFYMNESPRKLAFDKIKVPSFKQRNKSKFDAQKPFQYRYGRSTDQINKWKSNVKSGAEDGFDDLIKEADSEGGRSREGVYYFKPKRRRGVNENLLITGEKDILKSEHSEIPFWDLKATPTNFQVDHIVENQMGGDDEPENYELLEAGANSSSGSRLANHINQKLSGAIGVFKSDHFSFQGLRISGRTKYIKEVYNVIFEDAEFTLGEVSGDPDKFWDRDKIKEGKHWEMLEPLSGTEIEALGDQSDFKLFTSPSGGTPIGDLPMAEGDEPKRIWNRVMVRQLVLNENDNSDEIAHLNVDAYKSGQEVGGEGVSARYGDMIFYLKKMPGIYGGGIDKQKTLNAALKGDDNIPGNRGVFQSLRLPGLSPIEIEELDIDPGKGFVGRGKVLPTVPFISDADIELIIDGAEFRLRKLFEAEEINVPSPFRVENSSLEVFYSNQRGLGLEGRTDFGIEHVGEGHIGAAASTSGGFELEGAFNFDSELFDPASISVEYKDETWTIGGQIGIPEGKVRGIKNASITATYSEGNFAADGEAELDIPGIERGTMNVRYGDEGFSIGGAFDISSDVPGIQSGRVEATVSKQSGDEEYSVSVSGTARPDIPGVNATLSVEYENGALTIFGSADYSRGMLSGQVSVGATNRAIDEEGQPTGEPDDAMRVYGGGSLTLRLTPWLEATAGVSFLPNGEMEVQGRIGLPGTVDVFPRRQIQRNLFRAPTIEIPLFAIPLGPRSIGLVAQIGGGLDFEAGFGPGQLRELYAEVTYNPDREEETTLAGRGVFAIPADAGLTLRGDLGLGVSVAIASLSGGIELAGTLGLEGEALASVDVNWTPVDGIELDAEGRVTVNPKFKFDVNAFARGSLGVGFLSVSKIWRHRLAGFEWGPDIQFGIVFPVHYKEGEPFDMSFDDIEVIYPELNIPDMAKGLARNIKDDMF